MKHVLLATMMVLAGTGLALAQPAGLSPDQVEGLRAGKGMNLSLPAEKNGQPGPLHVLELAEPMGLAPEQRQQVEAIMADMRAAARRLGEAIIAEEAALDSLFQAPRADSAAVDAKVGEIARLNGELRLVHLRAHMATTALLRPDQVETYMRHRHHHHRHG